MTLDEIEGEATRVLKSIGFADDRPPKAVEVAGALGLRVYRAPHRALPGDGALVTVQGERCIYVRAGLPPERLRWVVGHELGHHVLELDSWSLANEDACDAFAAALLAPRRAFQAALRETGVSYSKLARWFVTTESCAALRFGEVTDVPLALVAPARVRIRGAEFSWPTDLRAKVPGVRRATLRDDRRRVVVRAG